METQKYLRKWEELNRALNRLKKIYENYIHEDLDSLQGPKDFVNNFFHISYELKEATKEVSDEVEDFAGSNEWVALSLDITNQEKHTELKRKRTNKQIGVITIDVHILDPNGKDRTELKIEIDGKKEDCLDLAEKTVEAWKLFLTERDLVV